MRTSWSILLATACLSFFSHAELQNVQVGGSIEIYGAWYSEFYEDDYVERIPETFLELRPIGLNGTWSFIRADGQGNSLSFVEQRTRLHVDADLTNEVRAFIEFDSIGVWGDDFRADYITGADAPAASFNDVEVYQSYIETTQTLGLPLRLRLGRQELSFGSGWLVGANPSPDPFTGLSFDAVRVTWYPGDFTVDAWWSKLAERFSVEQDGDLDFYGIYATYAGIEGMAFDAYWLFVRDALRIEDNALPWFGEWVEALFGLDDYDPTTLHTLGLRWAGEKGHFDWEIEGAWQSGEADGVGARFPLVFVPLGLSYGDNDARWDAWAAHAEAGYTFDHDWYPRVYLAAHCYSGEDNRALSLWDWLNPLHRPQASVSFNRLFSDYEVDAFIDGSAMTNFWMAAAGVSVAPTERVEAGIDLTYQEILEPFAWPAFVTLGNWRVPIAPGFPFLDTTGAKDLGWQLTLWTAYAWSEDLTFEFGWSHYFVGDGLQDGAFVDENGLTFIGSRGTHDAEYFWFMTTLFF